MVYTKKTIKKTKVTTHVCSECIDDFNAKDLFVAQVPDRDYTTLYCKKCLDKLELTALRPYHKVAEKKIKIETTAKTKKGTTTKTKTILKSEKDAKVFFDAISNPSKPNNVLIAAKRKYARKIK